MCPQEHKGYAVAFNAIAFLFHDAHGLNGVALMFLRAHGRKSMPVCLETLLFLCSFVLMFSALAADLIKHHNIPTSSLFCTIEWRMLKNEALHHLIG